MVLARISSHLEAFGFAKTNSYQTLFRPSKSRRYYSRAQSKRTTMDDNVKYSDWTRERLVRRVTELETKLREKNDKFGRLLAAVRDGHSEPKPMPLMNSNKKKKGEKEFDPSKYSTRQILLQFAYLGQNYNGYEHHANNTTPLPTIEEVLWKALAKTKLIFPSTDEPCSFEGCEYSKCGRTDRGVSAFGQVICIRVRSNEPKDADGANSGHWDNIRDEINYPRILNRVLPHDIHILAWCPAPRSDFSARFSCVERRYRYFFTQPCIPPISIESPHSETASGTSNGSYDGWLDIQAMQEAAQAFQGLHDFRNFCKQDPARQITDFKRRITHASIHEADSCSGVLDFVNFTSGDTQASAQTQPKVYCFELHGSAFLWHQVRCMVAVLFLIGQGFESKSVVSDLLDISRNPQKPIYLMADEAPLVLWECIFPGPNGERDGNGLPWIYEGQQLGDEPRFSESVWGPTRSLGVMWSVWRKRKIDEVLAGSLLDTAIQRRGEHLGPQLEGNPAKHTFFTRDPDATRVFEGANEARPRGRHVPLLSRERIDSPEVLNARFRERKAAGSLQTIIDDGSE